jgi:hypothetical protein
VLPTQHQAEDNDRNKRGRSVPDNLPDDRNIADMHFAGQQRQRGHDNGTSANTKSFWLPNNQCQRQNKNRIRQKHTFAFNTEPVRPGAANSSNTYENTYIMTA